MTTNDGTGPYLRAEVTIAMAVITSGDHVLNDDMLDTTLAFGVGIADGDRIDAGEVTTEQTQALIAQQLANLAQAVRVFVGQNLAFLGPIEEGRGMIDDVRETAGAREVTGYASIHVVGGEAARA